MRSLLDNVMFETLLETYLRQCRVLNRLVEDDNDTHFPPTKDEVGQLIRHLRDQGLDPKIIGSVGILHHLGNVDVRRDFRPTVDLDIFVAKDPGAPMAGWKRDPEAPGITSWISPSGGYVDFMSPSHQFPGGEKAPKTVAVHEPSAGSDYPVAHAHELLKLKLNSMRPKDIADALALVRKLGYVPDMKDLGRLTPQQRDNYQLLKQWFTLAPTGEYGA